MLSKISLESKNLFMEITYHIKHRLTIIGQRGNYSPIHTRT